MLENLKLVLPDGKVADAGAFVLNFIPWLFR